MKTYLILSILAMAYMLFVIEVKSNDLEVARESVRFYKERWIKN